MSIELSEHQQMRRKALDTGLEQLAQEGVIQISRCPILNLHCMDMKLSWTGANHGARPGQGAMRGVVVRPGIQHPALRRHVTRMNWCRAGKAAKPASIFAIRGARERGAAHPKGR